MIELSDINRSEALRYMGYSSNIDIENILPIIDECEKKLLNSIQPRYIYKICDIKTDDECISIVNSTIKFHSNDILCHLEGCDKAVFLACTLSNGADRLISEYQVKDMSKAIIADCMASAAIEQVCDIAEQEIREHIGEYYMTWRFSPGYGDLSIEYQKDFLAITDAGRKIGLTLNPGNILIPRKSVTAIIGLSKNPIPKRRQGCAVCNMRETCQFRSRGEHCGF